MRPLPCCFTSQWSRLCARSHLIEAAHETEQGRINLAVMLVSLLVLAAFILLALLLKGVI